MDDGNGASRKDIAERLFLGHQDPRIHQFYLNVIDHR
jgi:hypothetical protein